MPHTRICFKGGKLLKLYPHVIGEPILLIFMGIHIDVYYGSPRRPKPFVPVEDPDSCLFQLSFHIFPQLVLRKGLPPCILLKIRLQILDNHYRCF